MAANEDQNHPLSLRENWVPITQAQEGRLQNLEPYFWCQLGFSTLALPLSSCVTLEKVLNLSELFFTMGI